MAVIVDPNFTAPGSFAAAVRETQAENPGLNRRECEERVRRTAREALEAGAQECVVREKGPGELAKEARHARATRADKWNADLAVATASLHL